MTDDPWEALLTAPSITQEELDEIKAGIMRLAENPLDEPATLPGEQA